MPSNTLQITQSGGNALPNVARKVVRFGLASLLATDQILELSRGQQTTLDVVAGYGDAVEESAQALRVTGQDCILVKVASDIAGTIGSVTETPSGTGPTITVTGTPTMALPELFVKVTKAGAAGVAQARIALDGGTYGPTIDIPAEAPAVVMGTVDLTGITLSSLNTLTLLIAPNGGGDQTVTFTTPSSVADIATQINAQTTLVTASIVGGRFLRIETDLKGTTASIQINATSTSEVILGLDTTLHTGAASTYALVGTGLTVTFPAGDYVLDTIYSLAVTAPRFSLTALGAAMDAFKAANLKVGLVSICQDPLDATEARQLSDYVKAKMASWETDTIPLYAHALVGSSLGTAAAISTNDAAVKAAFTGETNRNLTVDHGDVYTTGSFVLGSFRRSARVTQALRLAAESLSEDPGNGEFANLSELECSLTHPNGTTKARDENTATVKMFDSGFTVLETRDTLPYFVRGRTRAVAGSKFEDIGVLRMALYAADLMWSAMLAKKNITRDLAADGTLRASDRKLLEAYYTRILEDALLKGAEKHASALRVEITASTNISSTKTPIVKWTVQHRAQITKWEGTLEIVGIIDTGANTQTLEA